MNEEKTMQAEPQVEPQVEQTTAQDEKAEMQAVITKEFQLLIADLKLNQYGSIAIEVFVNKVLQMMQ